MPIPGKLEKDYITEPTPPTQPQLLQHGPLLCPGAFTIDTLCGTQIWLAPFLAHKNIRMGSSIWLSTVLRSRDPLECNSSSQACRVYITLEIDRTLLAWGCTITWSPNSDYTNISRGHGTFLGVLESIPLVKCVAAARLHEKRNDRRRSRVLDTSNNALLLPLPTEVGLIKPDSAITTWSC
jgi:hypothetical protein